MILEVLSSSFGKQPLCAKCGGKKHGQLVTPQGHSDEEIAVAAFQLLRFERERDNKKVYITSTDNQHKVHREMVEEPKFSITLPLNLRLPTFVCCSLTHQLWATVRVKSCMLLIQ